MQAHHVIDTQQARVSQVIADECDEILISIQPHGLRMQWRKTPVLTFRKYQVRRRSSRDTANEKLAVMPDIVTFGMQAQRQVEVQHLTAAIGSLCQCLQLLLNDPLGIEM